MKLFRIATTILLLTFGAGLCFAPIEGKPPEKSFHGELSDDEMARHQRGNMTSDTPDGAGGSKTNYSPTYSKNDESAANVLSGSIPKNESQAHASLKQAEKDLTKTDQKGNSPGKMVMMGAFFLLLGVMAAFGIRTYLDKAVPDSLNSVKKQNPWS